MTFTAAALLTVLILCRSVRLTTTPRVWAEEGTVYLSSAWKEGVASLADPHLGYYSLLPNFAAYIASTLPLAWVPIPLMLAGFVAMLACGATVLTSRSGLFDRLWVRLVATMGLVCVPAASGELWLNSINAQTFLTVAAFVIIIEPAPRAPQLVLYAIAALTAPAVAFLLPLLILRFLLQTPSRRSIPLLAIAALCAMIQISAFVASSGSRPNRNPVENGSMAWLGFVGKMFLGPHISAPNTVIGVLALITLGFICVCCRNQGLVIIGIVGSVWLFALNTAFSLGQAGGYRYWFAPSVVLLMTLSFTAGLPRGSVVLRVVAGMLCIVLLTGGVKTYFGGMDSVADKAWITWESQIGTVCDKEPATIKIWPQVRSGWSVRIPPRICEGR